MAGIDPEKQEINLRICPLKFEEKLDRPSPPVTLFLKKCSFYCNSRQKPSQRTKRRVKGQQTDKKSDRKKNENIKKREKFKLQ